MQRMERGGSIVGFIIICLVGAVLLVGGVYALHHVDWFKTNASPATVSTPGDTNSSNSNDANSSTKPSPATTDTPHPSTTKDKSATGDHSSSSTESQASSATPSTPSDNTPSASSSSDSSLPHTGPSDVFVTVIALGALTAAILSYARSRRIA